MGERDPAALRRKLGSEAQAALERLDDDGDRFLAELAEARRKQGRELHEAAEGALRHVPRLLRPAAKKIVFG